MINAKQTKMFLEFTQDYVKRVVSEIKEDGLIPNDTEILNRIDLQIANLDEEIIQEEIDRKEIETEREVDNYQQEK